MDDLTSGLDCNGGSSSRVYRGVMDALERGRMVPGQRLAETDLASRYGVGRNAVREAIQKLAGRGVVDLSRHRSPTIRQLDYEETMEVLDVASVLSELVARTAALRFDPGQHKAALDDAMITLELADNSEESGAFSKARRNFYRTLLMIGGNRELLRLFPAVSMHIIYAQHQTPRLRGIRLADYRQIMDDVAAKNPDAAAGSSRLHVEHIRDVIAHRGMGAANGGNNEDAQVESAAHAIGQV
ncbi:GntR family transcriptional regulator [Rhizorhapis sp. SPR117]|uniref:GntR family transcriptional regulator n=1 Tax=Rhizorhapis sp. SPR117 TaxID=2912611 RepID=UPI001F414EA0|nr:GntR family transcriptional regulator [Rhizorhapis sp. SPR117]